MLGTGKIAIYLEAEGKGSPKPYRVPAKRGRGDTLPRFTYL